MSKDVNLGNSLPLQEKQITINKKQFQTISKKLLNDFKKKSVVIKEDESDKKNFTLSLLQESLSQAIGFRNYHGLTSFFDKESKISNNTAFNQSFNMLNDWTSDYLIKACETLFALTIPNNPSLIKRAITLMSIVISALVHLRDIGEYILELNTIREYLILDNIIKLYKTRRDLPHNIHSELKAYLGSLPGFLESAPKQNDTVNEYHTQLQIEVRPILELLDKLSQKDPIIFAPEWFDVVYSNKISNNEFHDDSFILPHPKLHYIETYSTLSNELLEKLYKKIPFDEWNDIFTTYHNITSWKEGFKPAYVTEYYSNHIGEQFYFNDIKIKKSILQNQYYDDSWLSEIDFQNIMFSIMKNRQLKTFYLSDFLFHTIKIINPTKRQLHMNALSNLLNNYSTVMEHSEVFHRLSLT